MGEYCTDCFTSELSHTAKKSASASIRLGEGPLSSSGYGRITGRGQLSKREINILQAASAEEPSKIKIHKKAEAAIRWLNLPRTSEIGILETVEKKAMSIVARMRSDFGRTTHVSSEKVVAYSLLVMTKLIGKTIVEVQEALAKAGFNIKLHLFTIRIAVPPESNISKVTMYANGWKKDPKSFRPREVGEGPLGKEYTVSIQTYLSDAIDQRGKLIHQTCKVHFENAIVLVEEPAILDRSGPAQIFFQRTASLPGNDHSTVWLKLDSKRCFALFKSINRMLEKSSELGDNVGETDSTRIESSFGHHVFLPSKRLPVSSALMRKARCLDKFERRSLELFRESLNNSNGRSRRTLAREALFQADEEIFSSLPKPLKQYMRGYITTLPLKRKDRTYAGLRGLLIPGEVLRVESN